MSYESWDDQAIRWYRERVERYNVVHPASSVPPSQRIMLEDAYEPLEDPPSGAAPVVLGNWFDAF